MPLSPQQVQDIQDRANLSFVEFFIKKIDAQLSDPKWLQDWRYGTVAQPFWQVVVPGTAMEGDKEVLIEKYKAAGWPHVSVGNSADRPGERAGFCGIRLYKYPHHPTPSSL